MGQPLLARLLGYSHESGAQPQVISAFVCPHIQTQLYGTWIGAMGVSFDQYLLARCGMHYLLQSIEGQHQPL